MTENLSNVEVLEVVVVTGETKPSFLDLPEQVIGNDPQ
jgi:hypothetical protein